MNKDKQNRKLQKKQAAKGLAPQQKWWRDQTILAYLAIVAIAVVTTFSPALKNGFVNWDDDVNVYENPNIDSLSAGNIQKIFSTPVIGGYNPLPILTFAVEK